MADLSNGAAAFVAKGLNWLQVRLAGRRAMLIASLLLFSWLGFAGLLSPQVTASAFGLLVLVAVFVPNGKGTTHLAAEAEATGAQQRLAVVRAVADTLVDPCLVLDRRSVIIHANPMAAGEFPAAVSGTALTSLLRHPALIGAIDAARRLGEASIIELHQTVPNQTWHKVAVVPLRDIDGPPTGTLIVTLQNLTDQKRSDAMRSDFIANASHELRTPLTSLVGFIDTLLGPAAKDREARERFLTIMRTQAGRMSKLIDDLLSLNRIEMRQHVRPTGTVDLLALLAEVREGLQTQAKDAGLDVVLALKPAKADVTGDHDELYEVFENLIDNAIKYGADGGRVEITLDVATGRSGYDFAIGVVDHGAGIEPVHVPRLTERFYRVDAESSRKKKGTGLGLAIVKHIINRHRGLLTIKSRPGEGTRVEVLLPR